MKAKKGSATKSLEHAYDDVLADVVRLIGEARRSTVRSVNSIVTATYWSIGRRIFDQEQRGAARAGYGEELVLRLSVDLQTRFGRGFGRANLFQMRAFFLAYREIVQTLSGQLAAPGAPQKVQTASGQLTDEASSIAVRFPLPWSHYVRLPSVRNSEARKFCETEALRGGWTMRQLARQIDSQFYERAALSRNKASMLRKGQASTAGDAATLGGPETNPSSSVRRGRSRRSGKIASRKAWLLCT